MTRCSPSLLAGLLWSVGLAAAAAPDGGGLEPEKWIADELTRPPAGVAGEPGRPFPWSNTVSPGLDAQVTKAQAVAWEKQLRAVADFLAGLPLLREPRGFYPAMRGHVAVVAAGRHLDAPNKAPLAGGLDVSAWIPEAVAVAPGGKLKKKPHHQLSLRIEFNYIYTPRGEEWMRDDQGPFGVFAVQGYHAGFPIADDMLWVTRDGRLPLRPVSQQSALKAFIRHHTSRLQSNPTASLRRAVADAEARLAAMTPEEGARPAWVRPSSRRGQDHEGIQLVDAEQGNALVAFDESFFDPRQPREQLRLVLVRELRALSEAAHRREQGPGTVDARVALLLFQQVNWQELAKRFLQAR